MMKKIKFIISALLLSVLFARAELTVSDTRVSDDFNRSVGASSQGSMGTDIWMNGFSEGSQWGIADNQAFANFRKGAIGLLVNKAVKLGREFTLCVDVKALSDNRWAGLLFNYKDENNYSYFRFKSGTENWAVQQVVDGVQHRIGAAGRLKAGGFKSNMFYTLTLSSTPDRRDLKITETASEMKMLSDFRSVEEFAGDSSGGFGGLFQVTPGNDLVRFDNFKLKVASEPVSESQGSLRFASVFNDGAVLQCDLPVNIWGTAAPGENVTVTFAGQTKTAVADSSKHWKVMLDPMPASDEPRTMSLSSSSHPSIQCSNLTVGEVWLASGQSNMAQPLKNSLNGPDRLEKTIPEIHFVIVPQKTGLPVEAPLSAKELAWKEFCPETSEEIASVAFYFAEQIQQKTGRQVGIIQSSYGGTPCEAWTPVSALDKHPELKYLADQIRSGVAAGRSRAECEAEIDAYMKWWRANRAWQKTKNGPKPTAPEAIAKGNPWSSKSPSVLYENMIAPLIPYTTRGVIWYQGEANVGRPEEYRVLFPAMINAWRTQWNRPDWPFFFVQLAAYGHPSPLWKELCISQAFVRDTVENTGMAVAIDCGDKKNIHPHAKQPVGERLARLALAQVYGQDVVSRGPAFQGLEKKNDRVLVHFQYSEKGLKTSDAKAEVPDFELAGADRKFKPAEARIISSDTVEVVSSVVPDPAFIRYAWDNFPEPPVTLQNSAGLPTEPFSVTIEN